MNPLIIDSYVRLIRLKLRTRESIPGFLLEIPEIVDALDEVEAA